MDETAGIFCCGVSKNKKGCLTVEITTNNFKGQ